ncbi:hypothetical protein HZP42_17355 [Elizabethkingia anophelis]|uniref:hypothetical protein n=1 Tax=Elizabethkingia anophelis TaxID=1117645 RepID=UPI0006679FD7|nr:hypothetical protein [Elizabethkingia anophelis]AQW89870.1 hypothetical protein BBD28_03985 [Elizabethkingia anophelis]KUY13505.1 hypothetical protein ATB94_10290 [Elizabethkingia anophelis]MCT3728703.1 hypothetical protein [Elizabethkingia anophelis]MCT4238149.1 hypothetical protein [Elizabethkingia anophelis]MCT4304065.1 hypothetical protein [Elizabethkingia anophelis]
MKKLSILLFTIPGFYFAQLATPQGQMLATEKPNTGFVGIGTTNPISNLEIASPTATLTLSTNQASGTAENPLYPKIDFLGYANWPKARITAAEQTYNTHGSKLSFLVNDGTGATSLKEMMTINQDSKVGIGITNPTSKLEVYNEASKSHLTLSANDNSANDLSRIDLDYKIQNKDHIVGRISSFYLDSGNGGTGGLRFFTREAGQLTEKMMIAPNGNISVSNKLEAKEIKVTTTPTADFVFEDSYQLPNLESVEKHIKEKKHLPEIASASEMQKEGVNIGDFQIKLLQKIEELTLYQIQLNKEVTNLKQENIQLKETVQKIQNHEKSY